MTDIAALFGVILISAVVMLIMREQSKTAASLVAIAVSVCAFVYAALQAGGVFEKLTEFVSSPAAGKYVKTLLKGLGVVYLTAFTASFCRDLGSENAAKASELIGKTELVLLSVPLTLELAEIAGELLK